MSHIIKCLLLVREVWCDENLMAIMCRSLEISLDPITARHWVELLPSLPSAPTLSRSKQAADVAFMIWMREHNSRLQKEAAAHIDRQSKIGSHLGTGIIPFTSGYFVLAIARPKASCDQRGMRDINYQAAARPRRRRRRCAAGVWCELVVFSKLIPGGGQSHKNNRPAKTDDVIRGTYEAGIWYSSTSAGLSTRINTGSLG